MQQRQTLPQTSKAQQPVLPNTPAPKSVPLPLDPSLLGKISGGTSGPNGGWAKA